MRFSTRARVQAAYRAAPGVGAPAPAAVHDARSNRVETPGARRTQGPDDSPPALVLEPWPESSPPAILSVPARGEAGGDEATARQAREDDPASREPRVSDLHQSDGHAVASEEPDDADADEDWDILDWIYGR